MLSEYEGGVALMADNKKMSNRDQALIDILERLAREMEHQKQMLEDLNTLQNDFSKSVETMELQRRSRHIDSDKAHDKLFESFHHYRSDMLSLVNEQDRINSNIDNLEKLIKNTTFALETSIQKLKDMDGRLKHLEKAFGEHSEHSLKQETVLRDEMAESTRNFTKLHADTEKHLGELHTETGRQLDKFQHEIMRRLLMLDGIVTSLQTLLIRTEPPEKRPLWIVRLFRKVIKFFRFKLPLFFRSLFSKRKN